MPVALGIDVGGTKIAAGLVDSADLAQRVGAELTERISGATQALTAEEQRSLSALASRVVLGDIDQQFGSQAAVRPS
jgi:predicted NBD/HSP70 family sugar kinase